MYAPGHVGLALLAFAPVGYRLARTGKTRALTRWLPVVVCCGLLPDIDLSLASVGHRMITHTPVAAVSTAVLLGGGGVIVASVRGGVDRRIARSGAVVGLVGVGSHLAGDLVTPMGIAPALPLSATRVTLDLVAARDPTANAALLTAGVLVTGGVYAVGYRQHPRWPVTRRSRSASRSSGNRNR